MSSKRGLGSSYGKDNQTTETQLTIDNDQRLYEQKKAIEKNLARHLCRGNFSAQKAKKAFSHLTTAVNRQYKKEFHEALPLSDRREAERDMTAEFVKGVRAIRAGKGDVHGLGRDVVSVLNKCPRKKLCSVCGAALARSFLAASQPEMCDSCTESRSPGSTGRRAK